MAIILTPDQARGGESGASLLTVLVYSLGLSTVAMLSMFVMFV
jgi:hypothetical protein